MCQVWWHSRARCWWRRHSDHAFRCSGSWTGGGTTVPRMRRRSPGRRCRRGWCSVPMVTAQILVDMANLVDRYLVFYRTSLNEVGMARDYDVVVGRTYETWKQEADSRCGIAYPVGLCCRRSQPVSAPPAAASRSLSSSAGVLNLRVRRGRSFKLAAIPLSSG